MEYKIRANNQKEAVEVYKAIRQIQQGKCNITVNADNRKDAVRIYKEAKRVCDSKLKDGLRKKINDESITLPGDWNKAGADAAKRMGLTFTLTGRYALGLPVAKISGDKQKLIKYIKKWYDPDFFEDGYDLFDSKFTDSKLKDKQNLVRGDWFVRINDLNVGSYVNIPLYKVLDMQTHDDGMIYVDVYHIKSDIKQNKTMLVHGGTSWFKLNNSDRYGVGLSGLTIFSSADEALKWAKQIVATRNSKR